MFNLDLKRAETALHAGRLEEACQILRSSSMTRHAAGQKLLDRLVDALIARSQNHFDQENLSQARSDLAVAKKLAGSQTRIVELETQINRHERLLAQRSADESNGRWEAEVSRLIAAGQHEEALVTLRKIQRDGSVSVLDNWQPMLEPAVTALTNRAAADLVAGHLDRCQSTLATLNAAGFRGTAQQELKTQLGRCYNVRRAVEQSNYAEASRELKLLARKIPDASWINEMLESVQLCMDHVESVKAGPFGLLDLPTFGRPVRSAIPVAQVAAEPMRSYQSSFMNNISSDNDPLQEHGLTTVRSILQVDQLGSLLLVQGNVCSVGSASASNCDVTLQTEGSKDRILVCRDGEDYFASCRKAFLVNDRLADRHLLNHGDTIRVGKRGRLKFSQPVAASSTAVLQISGSKMKRRDIRAIVLFDDVIMFGRGRGHFRLPSLATPIILRAASDSGGDFLIHQQGERDHKLLRHDSSLLINDCQFSLSSTDTTRSNS